MQNQTYRFLIPVLLLFCNSLFAQDPEDTEFRKGWVNYLKLDNGVISDFHKAPDLYVGGVRLNPQITVIQHKLRLGVNAGVVYGNKQWSGLFGPSVALKLKSFNLKSLAGLGNLQLIAEHHWGTEKQRLAGGGIGLELLQKLMLLLTAQRDYKLNSWWIQSHIGLRINKPKSKVPEFNQ